jgi:hypothetical protein
VIEQLSRELAAVGVRGRDRERILAEAADHLASGPAAEFGDPKVLAAQFAEVLGAARARRAAWVAFGALALAGGAYALAFWTLNAQGRELGNPRQLAAAVGLILLPQVSFVGGLTALVARTPRLALRRTLLGLVAGAGTLACAAVLTQRPLVVVPLAVAGAALAAAAAETVAAARIRTTATASEPALTWRQGLAIVLLAAAAVGVAGASGGDPGEGVRNALVESVAAMSGFAVLGRAIGIRR